jgi:hypothetical protein
MERYSRYEDAMIAKLRIHEWYSSTVGEAYLRGFFEDLNRRHDPQERLGVDGLVYLQRQMIQLADPIYVGDEIVEIVDRARWTFEPEALLPGDPFTPRGFAILPRPLYIDDAPWDEDHPGRFREGVPVRAIGWLSMHDETMEHGCFWISFFTHVDDAPDEQRHMAETAEQMEYFRRYAPLSLAHQWQWTWGNNPMEVQAIETGDEEPGSGTRRARQQAALVQTFWRIGQQRVTVPERVPRGVWRDAERKGMSHREVKVMLLRRAHEHHPHEPTGRQMKVRSITDGHWRWQNYGKKDEEPYKRQIWISPYVRGPEGAPFIHPDKAIEFTR